MNKKILSIVLIIVIGLTLISCNSSYVVNFNPMGGSHVSAVIAKKGSTILSSSVIREGYTLEGWFTSQDGGKTLDEKWSFTTSVVNNTIVLYAKWKPANLTFGGSNMEEFSSVIQDGDGNYVAVGVTNSNDFDITDKNDESYDALIVKYDSNGDILWDKTIGGSNQDSFSSLIEDGSGNYVVVGYTFSNDSDITDGNNGQADALIWIFNDNNPQ